MHPVLLQDLARCYAQDAAAEGQTTRPRLRASRSGAAARCGGGPAPTSPSPRALPRSSRRPTGPVDSACTQVGTAPELL